jgi:hypothetical protein
LITTPQPNTVSTPMSQNNATNPQTEKSKSMIEVAVSPTVYQKGIKLTFDLGILIIFYINA